MVHRLLDWEDELFLVLQWLLDRQSLSAYSASFADSLYGLRRAASRGKSGDTSAPKLLTPRQQHAALLVLVSMQGAASCLKWCRDHAARAKQVSVPYLSAKLEALYHRHSADARQEPSLQQQQARPARASLQPLWSWLKPVCTQGWHRAAQRLALAAFVRVWPFAHATREALRFAYQLLYLLDGTAYFSPTLHLLRQRVIRVTGQELVRACLHASTAPCSSCST